MPSPAPAVNAPPALDGVPQELKNKAQWVGWREEPRKGSGELTKPPINPRTGHYGSPADPDTWGTLEESLEACGHFNLPGVGFALAEGSGIVAIDLDHCRDPETGALTPLANRIMERFNSYTEVSPSGEGVHIFVLGQLPLGARRTNGIEMYDSGHYMTVTGNRLESVSALLEGRQDDVDALHAWISGDAELVAQAQADDLRFAALWDGDTSAYQDDHSRADQSLCNMLARRCNRDTGRMDRIFRWSGLMRPKWDEKHSSDGRTYGQMTLEEALEHSRSVAPAGVKGDAQPARLKTIIFDPDAPVTADAPVFKGLLNAGDLAVWLGREKHRKTNVILQAAISAALGRPFLCFSLPTPIQVVIIDYETKAESLKRRYDSICDALNLNPEERKLLKRNLQIILVREMIREGVPVPRFPIKPEGDDYEWWRRLVADNPAQLYVIDPMRSLHAQDENDSNIEALLSAIRAMFGKAAVIVAHHLRKRSNNGKDASLTEDMRGWSDQARGSGAIKAHADVIICQERRTDWECNESVYLGAFSKDAADAEPLKLAETDHESFLWRIEVDVPTHLNGSWNALRASGRVDFPVKADVLKIIQSAGASRPTAYRHLAEMQNRGLIVAQDSGGLKLVADEKAGANALPRAA